MLKMKRSSIYFILFILCSSNYFSQTVDGQFITNISPPTYSVTIAVNLQSGTGTAGVVSIEFTYNNTDLSFPATPVKNTDYVLYGNFDTWVTQNITRPSANAVRINLITTQFTSPPLVPLSTTPNNIIILYFTIVNQTGSSNLQWVTTNIAPQFLSGNYTIGNWPNVNDDPLPVELSSFTAVVNQDIVNLEWQTKTEVNNHGFNIERKINEGEWRTLGFVEGNGNTTTPKEYSYSDKDIYTGGSKFQYRLKQMDYDGSFEYSDVVEVEVVPTQYELSQNYPNPFNPSTTIKFSLPKQTQMKINLYNMLGELVETIAEGNYEAGNYKINFNASALPSGAYFYRIESDAFVQVKKMLLLK